MKIIFLDFDGVLNSAQEVDYHHRKYGGKRRLSFLHSIVHGVLKRLPKKYQPDIHWTLYHLSHHCHFCPIACSNIQTMLESVPDARIVVSSVWRSWGEDYLKKIFKRNGIDPSRFLDVTPCYYTLSRYGDKDKPLFGHDENGAYSDGQRGRQIQFWLNKHGQEYNVDKFVILDDDSDMAHLMPYLFQTDNINGLMKSTSMNAIFWLNYDGRSFLEKYKTEEKFYAWNIHSYVKFWEEAPRGLLKGVSLPGFLGMTLEEYNEWAKDHFEFFRIYDAKIGREK